jgi:deoxyribodipyrimidine photo-lyase
MSYIPEFPTDLKSVLARIDKINPTNYARNRNFVNGPVTYLSPYISRGVITIPQIVDMLETKGHHKSSMIKLVQELSWREYFQRVWQALGDDMDKDIKRPQEPIASELIPEAIVDGKTGITGVDNGIAELYATGYMHNHNRMYTASITTNVANCHWPLGAKWMYYHLLDADWASNALGWQWCAGTFSGKKYFAIQDNINKYTLTNDKSTYLSVGYDDLDKIVCPADLQEYQELELTTKLPITKPVDINPALNTLVYNWYNLDPKWYNTKDYNRVLLIEPSHFAQYPISPKSMKFMLDLAKNIDGIQIMVGEFSDLAKLTTKIFYKEHPTNSHYTGTQVPREWLWPSVDEYYPSFFGYWKNCEDLM